MLVACSSCGAENRVPGQRLGDKAHCGRCKTAVSPIAHPVALKDRSEFDELVQSSSLPVLLDFWATWCPPCRAVAPELEKLARARAGQVVVAKLDTDTVPEVAERFGIRSIPTLVLFRNGREAKRVSGAMPATAIAQALEL